MMSSELLDARIFASYHPVLRIVFRSDLRQEGVENQIRGSQERGQHAHPGDPTGNRVSRQES